MDKEIAYLIIGIVTLLGIAVGVLWYLHLKDENKNHKHTRAKILIRSNDDGSNPEPMIIYLDEDFKQAERDDFIDWASCKCCLTVAIGEGIKTTEFHLKK